MASEGTYNKGFRLQVPEEHLHHIFSHSLNKLFGQQINPLLKTLVSRNIKLQYAPQIIRYFIPIPDIIPELILNNKEFAREYLLIAFESEGCPLLNQEQHKRYIKLTRNVGIDELIKVPIKFNPGERIFLGKLKKTHPSLCNKISQKIPPLLLGESLLLSHYFKIENSLRPEALLVNKTSFRTGFYSVRWNLCIYADSVDRYIKEINFISKKKRKYVRIC